MPVTNILPLFSAPFAYLPLENGFLYNKMTQNSNSQYSRGVKEIFERAVAVHLQNFIT